MTSSFFKFSIADQRFAPRRALFRGFAILCLLVGALSLGACSAVQLGYKQADHLMLWWLGRYVNLTDEQTAVAKPRLAELLAWHRKNELPRYATFLDGTAAQLATDITPAQACAAWDEVRTLTRRSVQRALPGMAEVMVSFTDEQLKDIQAQQLKSSRKFDEKYRDGNDAERLKARVKVAVERLEDEYGNLSNAQEAAVSDLMKASPWNPDTAAADSAVRRQDTNQTLKSLQGMPSARATAELQAYYQRMETATAPELKARQVALTQYNCSFTAKTHALMNAEQRANMQKRLKKYADDFRELAKG